MKSASAGVLGVCMVLAARAGDVERWGVFEIELAGPATGNPYLEVRLSAEFRQGDRTISVPGFWDGGGTYRVRFSPPAEGEWTYVTTSSVPALAGRRGTLRAGPPSPGNHGPVRVHATWYLRYADGTPHHSWGTTCYAWTHQPEELQRQTLDTLARSPFNKLRFCVFPKHYAYNRNEPERFPFVRRADGSFDFDRPDPAWWRHFEGRILDLQRLGIEADVILWHPYDRWGFSEMSDEQDDRYLRYAIARLAAFRNVWWSLANEYDLMAPGAMKGHRGNKTMEDWDRFFQILQREDPYGRMRGIHNCRGFYDHTKPWVTHASVQSSELQRGIEFRERFRKPVMYDECRYEGNVPHGWGRLSGREMARQFWMGTMHGCYVGHGETYTNAEEVLWWSKGGRLVGESPARIAWLRRQMDAAPPFDELVPMGDARGRFVLGATGHWYMVFCPTLDAVTLDLAPPGPYELEWLDTWAMQATPLGVVPAGPFTIAPPSEDSAFRFRALPPGATGAPPLRVIASAYEGPAPLVVRFRTEPPVPAVRWELGDGTSSDRPDPEHEFRARGRYVVLARTPAGAAWTFVQVGGSPFEPSLRDGEPTPPPLQQPRQ